MMLNAGQLCQSASLNVVALDQLGIGPLRHLLAQSGISIFALRPMQFLVFLGNFTASVRVTNFPPLLSFANRFRMRFFPPLCSCTRTFTIADLPFLRLLTPTFSISHIPCTMSVCVTRFAPALKARLRPALLRKSGVILFDAAFRTQLHGRVYQAVVEPTIRSNAITKDTYSRTFFALTIGLPDFRMPFCSVYLREIDGMTIVPFA